MCLMQTDFPVPDGPRIIEIESSGSDMFRPRRTWLRPNDLCTSMNSIASGLPVGRITPAWNSSPGVAARGSPPSSTISAADRRARVRAPEDLRAEHPDRVHEDYVKHHRLGGRAAHADGATGGVVAVVAGDEHDRGGHEHRLDKAV